MVSGWPRSAGKVDLSSVNKRLVSTVLTLKGLVSLLSNDSVFALLLEPVGNHWMLRFRVLAAF